MSSAEKYSSDAGQPGLPNWLASGVLGIALGVGVTIVSMRALGYAKSERATVSEIAPPGGQPGGPPMSQPPASSAMAGGMGGPGMMGGMMGGMGGPGGSPGARAKRSLTTLVGKLALATKGFQFELSPEQATQVAAKVAELEKAEKLSAEDAEAQLASLEGILSEEQKAALAAFDLPRGGRPGGAGGGGGGGMAGATMGAMMGPPPDENDNPFRQEANQKRAQDLLTQLGAAPAATTPATEESKPAAETKSPAADETKTPPAETKTAPEETKTAPAETKPATETKEPSSGEAKPEKSEEKEETAP